MQKIRIKYFHDDMEKLTYIDGKSDWIDLRAAEDVELKAGEFKLVPLALPWSCQRAMRPTWFREAAPTKTSVSSRLTIWASSMKATAETTTSGSSRPMRSATQRSAGETASASSASWSISLLSYSKKPIPWIMRTGAVSEVPEEGKEHGEGTEHRTA